MTTPDLSCLTGVIGLANCACPCLEATAPTGWNDSTSGLFIADEIPLNMAETGKSCEDPTNPWNVLAEGRRMGMVTFMNDFRSRLSKRSQPRKKPVKAFIGESKSREVVTLTKAYAGFHMPVAPMRGGYGTVKKLGGVFDVTGTIVVQIYNQDNEEIGDPVTINTVGSTSGTLVEVAVNIPLPLWTSRGAIAQYWAAYEVDPNNLPRAIRIWCPCNGNKLPDYSTYNPFWLQTSIHRTPWTQWAMVGAWEGDNLTDFDLEAAKSLAQSGGLTNGLTMSIEFSCDLIGVICLDALDYSDPAALSAAMAYKYISVISTANKLLMNIDAYRSSAVTAELLAAMMPGWWDKYQENLEYATYHADLTQTDCVFCKPAFSISVKGKTP